MKLKINKYCCYECCKAFYTPALELEVNYCPYCNSDEIEIIEDCLDLNKYQIRMYKLMQLNSCSICGQIPEVIHSTGNRLRHWAYVKCKCGNKTPMKWSSSIITCKYMIADTWNDKNRIITGKGTQDGN